MTNYFKRLALLIAVVFAVGFSSNAQYYAMGSHLKSLLSPALSGSFNYKGYVEGSYLRGLGDDRFDVAEISTSQGFNYASWCFMGVGVGVDMLIPSMDYEGHGDYAVMVPLFADFRFNIGNQSRVGVSIDLRVGAAFNFNDNFRTNNGYLEEDECFYFRPTLSLRIPVSRDNPKKALILGGTYQLLMGDASCHGYWDDNKLFNNVGVTIGFEW